MNPINKNYPKWAREVLRFLGIKSQYILWGNIYDIFLYPIDNSNYRTIPLIDYLSELLTTEDSYESIIYYDNIDGFKLIKGNIDWVNSISGLKLQKDTSQFVPLAKSAEYIEKLIMNNSGGAIAVFLNFASRYTQNPESLREDEEFPFFTKILKLSYNVTSHFVEGIGPKLNTIFWFVDKLNDLPTWLTLNNPRLKIIGIYKPDNKEREYLAIQLIKSLENSYNNPNLSEDKFVRIFVDQTERMFNRDLIAIVQFMKKEGLGLEQISDAIRGYKLGIVENPWSKISKEKINNGIEILENRVKGQRQAVIKALDVIKRAYIGLSGAQHSKSLGKPKGVLFFAGPTGVGKTELAKAITELIFGSEQNYIRFDMSEFNHEHSDQRLIGAPPGYVGYEAGGELTNAVKQNPFSVILFDEIEKAHPKILDKFLQILEDGRLTDGRGETVYFSETLIIFTSNLGVYATDEFGNKIPLVLPNEPYEVVRERILKSIEDFFKFQIGRPEILNRIGENIIVFDFIRPEFANQIFDKMLNNIISKLWEDKKITLKFDDSAYEKLREECTKDLSMGGRGIGNKLEDIFVNPLSREIFERDVKEGDIFLIHDIILENNIWKITGEIKNNSFGR
jgi:energy-coupling factor transporter ATP-binding protein EcfA2